MSKRRSSEIVLTLTAADVVATLGFERAAMRLRIPEQANRIGISAHTLRRVLRGKQRPGRAICRHLSIEPTAEKYLSKIGS
jgi:transcriptional regulator with XRE-family HTH domain